MGTHQPPLTPNLDSYGQQGFRLSHFEALNWGTFDQKIWKMSPQQQNALLTGNIGSGKSTLVDGLATLLVPTRQLAFNKAAGAEDKERSLESYFKGFYTSQQDEYGKARAVGLRGKGQHYSVLLAQFGSVALDESLTIAQVFWLKPGESKVRRLFVVINAQASIASHFKNFGHQINDLKRQLRKQSQVELFDSFSAYAQAFSQRLGLGADGKALALFNQTISMKSVGSVTDFVRQNMLEKPQVDKQLAELERNFDALSRLHDAVLNARLKVQLLTPVSEYGDQALKAGLEKEHIEQCRDLNDQFMAKVAIGLYQSRIEKRQIELKKLDNQLCKLEQDKTRLNDDISQVKDDIYQNGGGRLEQLQAQIKRSEQIRNDSKKLYHNYQSMVQALDLPDTLEAGTFIDNQAQAKDLAEQIQAKLDQLDDDKLEQKMRQKPLEQQSQQLSVQIAALKQRKSNISIRQLQLRERICASLNLDESQLPFVGELIEVRPQAAQFQGAIERVLHHFALSLIVPDELYGDVSELVENTHLGTRLVYYRVKAVNNSGFSGVDRQSLLSKINIKPDSQHYSWLESELHQRFNYRCCDDLGDFRRADKAITPQGQIKSGKGRHEKDDRHDIHDKSRYILGWTNKQKIQLLQGQGEALHKQISDIKQALKRIGDNYSNIGSKRLRAQQLADFDFNFDNINWPDHAKQIEILQQEYRQLSDSSDQLQALQQKRQQLTDQLAQCESQLSDKNKEHGGKQSEINADQSALTAHQQHFATVTDQQKQQCFATLDDFYQKYIAKAHIRINELVTLTSTLRTKLTDRISTLESKRRNKEGSMIEAMGAFANRFENDAAELDKSIHSLKEYQKILKQLRDEDLPRHEARFKDMLNRDTIRAMALFRSHLDKQEEDIDVRIRLINQALRKLDYQPGTYIEIDAIASPDVDVREFKQRLKLCVEFATDQDDLYSEEKFIRVKDLIEQLRNEPKWTQKVVDVRHWHLFNVIERYREDDSEKECYSDSGGKSGGQKEKLAYSILAAAILLQYGLVTSNHGTTVSNKRRFNLVVIDEAFARGSKDSTRFGLELFKQLGLQLLLVTPLQKLDVIEHYVKHVHYVDQKNNRSMLLNMTISEYRQKLAAHHQQHQQQHQHPQPQQQQQQRQFQQLAQSISEVKPS